MRRHLAVPLIAICLMARPGYAEDPAPPDKTAQQVATLERGITFVAGEQIVRSLAWSPDGQKLAAGCSDRSLRLWTPSAKEPFAMVTLDRYG